MRRMNTAYRVIAAAVPAAIVLTAGAVAPAPALDNGLAETPPMGWNSWNQVRCYDLTEQVVRNAADALVETGMATAGYEYVVVDDCWQDHTRGPDGELRAHPQRFPDGMKALADYVHARGLKFGIYSSPGSDTCAMYWDDYPGTDLGSFGHEEQDARTFESWGVDYLKYDWCRADVTNGLEPVEAFTHMRDVLAGLDHDIVYSISEYGDHEPWTWARPIANLWRTTGDLAPNWGSVSDVIERQAPLAEYSGRPGAWNDPDMLQLGNGDLTLEENRSHLSMWALLNAPLFLGTDPAALSEPLREMVTNPEVIAIDQDFGGRQGTRIVDDGDLEVWGRALGDGGYVVVLYNRSGEAAPMRTDLATLGLGSADKGWLVRDVWAREDRGVTRDAVTATVPSHGVAMFRLSPAQSAPEAAPLLDVRLDGEFVPRDDTAELELVVENDGPTPVRQLALAVDPPSGWSAAAEGTLPRVLEPGQAAAVALHVTAPDALEAALVGVEIEGTAARRQDVEQRVDVRVQAAPKAPRGTVPVSTLPFLTETNGWGPVERDMSNGEQPAGDGRALTIDGVAYESGLGVHAESVVDIYAGGACDRLTATVGVDDEVGAAGSVTFEVRADGATVASTGVLTGAQDAERLDADVSGADVVELSVGDAGDGVAFDHADWADATLRCEE